MPTRTPVHASAEQINYVYRETALGLILMAVSSKGICLVEFGDDQPPRRRSAELQRVSRAGRHVQGGACCCFGVWC